MQFASPFAYVGPGFDTAAAAQASEDTPYDIAADGNGEVPRFRIDTNVMRVSMDVLSKRPSVTTKSPPITCLICEAVYGGSSEPIKANGMWVCEFCGQENDVREYGLDPARVSAMQKGTVIDFHRGGAAAGNAGTLTLFVMDVSGSMSLSKPIEGTVDQYISRLEAMQHCVVSQMQLLQSKNPGNRAGLITFHDHVDVHGDGTGTVIKIADDSLFEYDRLLEIGQSLSGRVEARISACQGHLVTRATSLHANGQTAMGPALVTALGIASQHPGSNIILCTDGLSNVGVGALSPESTDLERSFASGMFKRASEYAVDKGVSVSVVSIKGEECNLADLGALAEASGGRVHRVEPTELNEAVSELTANSSIATNVEARLFLHTSQYPYKDASPDTHISGLCSQTQNAASVSASTDLIFQFGPTTADRIRDLPLKPSNPFRMPFQLQISYTRDGMRRMMVLFDELPITDDWPQAHSEMRLDIMTAHAARCSAQMALAGDFQGAWQLAEEYKLLFEQSRGRGQMQEALYDNYNSAIRVLGGPPLSEDGTVGNGRISRNPTYDIAGGDSDGAATSGYLDVVPAPIGAAKTLPRIQDQTSDGLFRMMHMPSEPTYDSSAGFMLPGDLPVDLTSFPGAEPMHEADYEQDGWRGTTGEPLYATLAPDE